MFCSFGFVVVDYMVVYGIKVNEVDCVRFVCWKGYGGCCCKRFLGI